MKIRTLILVSFLFCCLFVTAQNNVNWRETQGKIIHIEKYRTKRYVNEKATVEYNVQGDTTLYRSKIMLDRIPFIGSLKSVGDVIEFSYDPNQPMILKSDTNVFINTYGIYILMFAGLGIFLFMTRKSLNQVKNKSQLNN